MLSSSRLGSRPVTWLLLLVTVASALLVSAGLRLEPNVASLLPDRGEAAALRRYARAFGGTDLAIVMVRSADPDENARVAAAIADELSHCSSVEHAASRVDLPHAVDPMLVFRYADESAEARLASALTNEGMRSRLRESRALLLGPGAGSFAAALVSDPLRLSQLAIGGAEMGSGMRTQADGSFTNDDGTMHLVLVRPRGVSLRGADARAFQQDASSVIERVGKAHPGVTLGITGGHSIAAATEAMLSRDLALSGTLSLVLASVVFVLIFRRKRALLAVMPPLLLGTLWTAGLAAILPGGLSAIAVAFMSVVVGVGVDTGVHVYSALLNARRAGLAPHDAARDARKTTQSAVLMAAVTAAAAFAALMLSEIKAIRQLGLLCAAGEVLTALAILAVTPEVGALLERRAVPKEPPSRWTQAIAWLTRTRPRALVMAALTLAPIPLLAYLGPPHLSEVLVAVRPKKLEPLAVQREIFEAFGGKRGQLIVLVGDRDPDRAHERADRIYERLRASSHVASVDGITTLAPAPSTQRVRYAARDALDLPSRAAELQRALTEVGFAPERFERALATMREPTHAVVTLAELAKGPASILVTRYLGQDEGERIFALYVQPKDEPDALAHLAADLRAIDPGATLTGYGYLDASLRASLFRDLPTIGLVAAVLVVVTLALSLRRARDVVLAALVVTAEIALVLIVIRVLEIPLHAYSALVLPVLLGITVDEGMFLLHHARGAARASDPIADTLRHEGPPVAATALTTAAGFGALAFCDFDGLRHLGLVGALGSTVGLLIALTLVPAGLRLVGSRTRLSENAMGGDCSLPSSDPFLGRENQPGTQAAPIREDNR